jgi:hypothetical protein
MLELFDIYHIRTDTRYKGKRAVSDVRWLYLSRAEGNQDVGRSSMSTFIAALRKAPWMVLLRSNLSLKGA